MNRTLALVLALGAGLSTLMFPGSAVAQAAAPAPAAAAAPAPVKPEAIPAKIALIFFDQAVGATNEGQKAGEDLQKKYAPQRAKLDNEAADLDALKKQLAAAPATITDADRTERLRVIDTKEKQYNLDGQDASAAFQADMQDVYSKIAPKVMAVTKAYCEQNGFTILLDAGAQQSNIMWVGPTNIDVTQAVIDAYNASSGVAAPPPAAPSAARPRPPTPAAPRPAAAKPATPTK